MNKAHSSQLTAHSYKKILIVRLDRIGDVLLSTPAIKAVRDAYPDSFISVMVRPYAEDIVKGNPYIDEVMLYDKNGSEKGVFANLKFILNLKGKGFDLAIILHPTERSHLMPFLAGIRQRIGYDRKWGFLLTKRVPHTKQLGLKHEIEYTIDLLRQIGIEPKEKNLYMPINDKSELRVEEIIARNGMRKDDALVVINPGASCPSKRWSPDNFVKVANGISNRYHVKIAIISDAKDKVFADKVAASVAGAVNLGGMMTVGDLASLLKRAKLLISNDSGPVHIACAVGTPAVAIFGRSDRGLSPARWGPVGRSDAVLHKYVGCEKCLAHNCKINFRCLEAVTVDEVLAAASKILGA